VAQSVKHATGSGSDNWPCVCAVAPRLRREHCSSAVHVPRPNAPRSRRSSMRSLCPLLLCVRGSAAWWLDPKYHLEHKPQLPEALAFAQPKCSKGLVVDVGANGGKETNAARALGYRVLAVECLVPEYMRLQALWLSDPMITLLSGCASDTVGLHAFHHASAGSSMHASAIAGEAEMRMHKKTKGLRVTNVPSFPLDPMLEAGPLATEPLCVLKIDVQGHEIFVLRGVTKAIIRHRPVVIFEYDPRFGPQVNETVPYMRGLGYDCAVPNPGKGPGRHCSVCNVLCMPDAAMWSAVIPPVMGKDGQKEDRQIARAAKAAGKVRGERRESKSCDTRETLAAASRPRTHLDTGHTGGQGWGDCAGS
jgi:FkbM family methyltransferase